MINELKDKVQQEAYKAWNESGNQGVCAIDMGSGKSKLAIDIINKHGYRSVLITSPRTNLKENWRQELEKWGFKWIDQITSDFGVYSFNKNPMVNITIENIQSSYKYTEDKIKSYTYIVIDEIHTIGPEYYKLIEIALRYNIPILGLTGTPNEEDEFKSNMLYKNLPIVFRYNDAAKDGLINKRKYFIYEYELTNNIKSLAGSKAKPFYKGELSQYKYLSDKYEEAKLEMFKLGASDYFNTSLLWMKGNQKIWITNKEGMPELVTEEATKEQKLWGRKFFMSIKARKEFLWNLTSSAQIAIALKHKILSKLEMETLYFEKELVHSIPIPGSCKNKVLLFSELTTQANKLSQYSIHSNNEEERNKKLLEHFNKGLIKELASVRSLTLGLNMTGANWAIFESYNGGDTDAKQKMGRTSRLDVNEMANIIFIVPKGTQAENWFKYLSKDLDLSEATIINNVNQLIV